MENMHPVAVISHSDDSVMILAHRATKFNSQQNCVG
jgi:hypothetical protein